METPTFVGLDISKNSIVATAVNPQGQRLDQSKIGSSDAELRQYLRGLPGDKRVVLEACTFWEHTYDAASAEASSVILSHPYKTRLIAETRVKTDKIDSAALATLLRLDAIPEAFAPPPELRRMRDTVKERVFYLTKEKSIKNHLYAYLMRKGIPYEEGVLGLKRKREALRELKDPVVDRTLDMLTQFQGATKDLDRAIHEEFERSREAQLLASIPGIGEITSVTLAAYLTPIDRFDNIDQVSAYCGLAPSTYQSGEREFHGHLRSDSHHLLRWILIEAGWKTRQYEKRGDVAKAGNRSSRRHGKGTGAVAAAHKLLKISYAVLRRGTAYQPHAPEPEGRKKLSADS